MNEQEIFSMFQDILKKLDTIEDRQQERCIQISEQHQKRIDSKISTKVFMWVTSVVIAGVISLAGWTANLSTTVEIIKEKISNSKELRNGD